MEESEKKDKSQDIRRHSSAHSIATTISIDHDQDQEHGSEVDLEANHTHEQNTRPKENLSRQLSRISSKFSPKYPGKVPRRKRRGLLAHLTIIPEVTDPYQYPRSTKWFITAIIGLAAMASPIGSAIIMPCLTPISEDFGVSPTVTNLAVALYMLAMSIFPLWWSSFSETLGRRTIYISSFVLFTLFAILSSISNSIGMLIAMRVLSGGAAASVQAVGAGTIADFWESEERGNAMGYFYLGPLTGPLVGPIIGGILSEGFNWRATQWFLAIYGGIMTIFLIFALPETLKARTSIVEDAKADADATLETEVATTGEAGSAEETKNAANISGAILVRSTTRQSVIAKRSKSTVVFLKRAFLDPLKIILLLRFPVVAISVFYASVTFGSLFFLNISIEDTFSNSPYNFSVLLVGLCYIPGSLGYVVASLLGGRWLDYIMKREAKRAGRYDEDGKLVFRPEDRMKENAWFAAFMYPCALLWYGWAAQAQTHWAIPVRFIPLFRCSSQAAS